MHRNRSRLPTFARVVQPIRTMPLPGYIVALLQHPVLRAFRVVELAAPDRPEVETITTKRGKPVAPSAIAMHFGLPRNPRTERLVFRGSTPSLLGSEGSLPRICRLPLGVRARRARRREDHRCDRSGPASSSPTDIGRGSAAHPRVDARTRWSSGVSGPRTPLRLLGLGALPLVRLPHRCWPPVPRWWALPREFGRQTPSAVR